MLVSLDYRDLHPIQFERPQEGDVIVKRYPFQFSS